jgi:5-methylcytosine-specific restriction endonuclease McrA
MSDLNEPHVAARARHIEICEGNLCAAIILNEFVYDFHIEREYYDDEVFESRLYTHASLVHNTFSLFSVEEINKALLLLMHKGYIKAIWLSDPIDGSDDTPFEKRVMKIVVHWEEVERACGPYYARIKARRDREEAERRVKAEEERAKLPPPPPPPTPEEIEHQRREQILAREQDRVKSHNTRAIRVNLPATLTLSEWLETLEHFGWKCAYCGGEYSLLEHFIPLSHYAGTTKDNCVPACPGCNSVKQSWHPDNIPYSNKKHSKHVQAGIVRVREYLESIKEARKQ